MVNRILLVVSLLLLVLGSGLISVSQERIAVAAELLQQSADIDPAAFFGIDPVVASADEVPSRIAYYKTQTEDPRILIAGDEKARFGTTVSILDEVRKAGIEKLSMETRTRATGK